MDLLSPKVYSERYYTVYIRSLMFYFVPGKSSELQGVRSRSAEEGESSSSLSDVLESFVGKLKDRESHASLQNSSRDRDPCKTNSLLSCPGFIRWPFYCPRYTATYFHVYYVIMTILLFYQETPMSCREKISYLSLARSHPGGTS